MSHYTQRNNPYAYFGPGTAIYRQVEERVAKLVEDADNRFMEDLLRQCAQGRLQLDTR